MIFIKIKNKNLEKINKQSTCDVYSQFEIECQQQCI